ncbi:MAG: type II CRISPR RNA-guided endonuclease Cas9 [Phycisphaerae bacterium]
MHRRLGLDLGSNSVGWAIVDSDRGRILDAGVRVFPEGVARDRSGGEMSKNETRRIARLARRRNARRRKRVARLKALLIEDGLLPEVAGQPRTSPERQAWEAAAFEQASPYQLRARALDKKLAPHEVGLALLHLCQRRGFLSSRKSTKAERKQESQMLEDISQLEQDIRDAGASTLGELLAGLEREDAFARLRGRHTHRQMHANEFDAIWAAQAAHHPDLLTDDLRSRVRRIIFYQRPSRVPKALIGTCELEPNRRRCPRADRRAQRLSMLMEVNNLLVIDEHGEERPLSQEERQVLIDYLAASERRRFDDIRKKLGLPESCVFNLERGERKSLLGMPTDKALRKIFGKQWNRLDEDRKNAIVRSLLDDSPAVVTRRAAQEWGLSQDEAEDLPFAELPSGYAAFSREAIAKLLPHIEAGHPLMTGDDRPCAITLAGYLRPDQRPHERLDRLPQPPDLPNPIVRAALHEVRKVVNAILRTHGPVDEVHVELARDVKGSLRQRAEHTRRVRQRERDRDRAADAIREADFRPTRDGINAYLLWEEQDRMCIYTGRPISLAQLLGGDVHVDHILPYRRSLDDSLMNKVVCFHQANRDKADRTPYEWLGESDPDRYEELILRARNLLKAGKLPYGKYRKLQQKEVVLDSFINRQLNDTAYISRAVAEYLRCLVAEPNRDMLATKGQLTAKVRYAWGLNSLLGGDGLNLKTREDHRHHALDAVVTAFIDRSLLQRLAREETDIDPPSESFRTEMQHLLDNMNVSHRVRRGVQGALHEENVYGRTEQPGVSVIRKPLEALTLNEVDAIRDPVVKRKVIKRLYKFELKPGRSKRGSGGGAKIPADVWAKPLWMNQEQGIPIRKVRVLKTDATVQPIRDGSACVKPGNTHHVAIFELPDGKRVPHFVTMLDAARLAREGKPLVCREHPEHPDAKFVMSLSGTELVWAKWKGTERLLQFRTGAATTGQLFFTDARDARPASKKEAFSAYANTLDVRKVTVDPLGNVRWAND